MSGRVSWRGKVGGKGRDVEMEGMEGNSYLIFMVFWQGVGCFVDGGFEGEIGLRVCCCV